MGNATDGPTPPFEEPLFTVIYKPDGVKSLPVIVYPSRLVTPKVLIWRKAMRGIERIRRLPALALGDPGEEDLKIDIGQDRPVILSNFPTDEIEKLMNFLEMINYLNK